LLSEALKRTPPGNESLRAAIDADLGSTYAKQEEFAKAEAAYLESLSLSRRLSNTAESALMLQNLGMLYSLQGRDQDALRFLNRAQDVLKTVPNPDPKVAVELLNATGILNYRLRNNGKAETFFNKALQAAQASGARIDTTGILSNLGAVYVSQRKFKQAEEVLGRVLMIKEMDLGSAHPALIPTLHSIAVLYTETHRYAEAELQYQRALKILEPQSTSLAPQVASVLHQLSALYRREGRRADSDATLENAAQIARNNLDKEPEMAAIVDEYSKILENRGNKQEAQELHAEAIRARTATGVVIHIDSM
jgi:tetratricopeptide (TPR) repeat protein